ncbi:MAG: glycosyltransferase family 39 protein [Planctomycetes bacterium]|nr:glycosyltransferase family 39 protein [Planctomycetota bacterium]
MMESDEVERPGGGGLSHRRAIVCLFAIWLCLVLSQLSPSFDMNPDSGRYVALAQSIAAGRGYTLSGRFSRRYPPLFPVILSAVTSPDRHDFRPEKLLVMLTGLGAMIASYWLLSQRYQGRTLLTLAVLVAVSPAFLSHCVLLRSDMPFFFFTAVFLAATNHFWRARKPSWVMAPVLAVALGAAALTRSAGMVFYVTGLAWLARLRLWRRDLRRCMVFGAVIIFIAFPPAMGWMAWVNSHREGGTISYREWIRSGVLRGESPVSIKGLSALVSRESRTLPTQVSNAARTVISLGGGTTGQLWALILAPIGLLGLARRMRRPDPSDYSFCGYSVMVLLWPWPQGVRLWMPVLPLMLGYLADGVSGLGHVVEEFPRLARWKWLRRLDGLAGRSRARVAWWGAFALLAVGVVSGIAMVAGSWQQSRRAIGGVYLTTGPLTVARFLNGAHQRPVTLAYARYLEVAPALTNPRSKVVGLPFVAPHDTAGFIEELRQQGTTHLAIRRKLRMWSREGRLLAKVREMLTAEPTRFKVVEETDYVQIFELPGDGP